MKTSFENDREKTKLILKKTFEPCKKTIKNSNITKYLILKKLFSLHKGVSA